MTQLTDIMDIQDLNIKSLQELARESSKPKTYEKWFEVENRLIEQRKAPSLPAYLLYEYQFNKKSPTLFGKEFGYHGVSVIQLMKKIGIPIKNFSESMMGREMSEEWIAKIAKARKGKKHGPLSEETKRKISEANSGKVRSAEMREAMSNYWRGRLFGENNPNYGNHLSEDARRRISEARKGKRLSSEHRQSISDGLKKVSKATRQRFLDGMIKSFRKCSYNVEGRFYASSQQEGAAALMFEKYIPGYQVKDEENFQVRDRRINNGGIDFLINKEFLEWHPIVFLPRKHERNTRGDIPTKEDFTSYQKVLSQIPETELEDFVREYKQVLAVNYRNKRQDAVDNSGYKGANVALATNEKQLYDFVKKFNPGLPSFEDFRWEFRKKIAYVKGFKVQKQEKSELASSAK